jgi:hypothetical protein
MSKQIQLTIADPCHENWDNMTPAEKGRFCASCQKQVIDFTNMSDSQLAAFFKKPSEGSVCGRFYNDQLDRNIEIPKKRIPWVKYFFQFALPAFLLSMKATAQGKIIVKKTSTTKTHVAFQMMGFTVSKESSISPVKEVLIRGKIVDNNNSAVPFASIMIKGRGFGITADSNGVFSIKKIVSEMDMILEASSVGYVTKEIAINKEIDLTKDVVVQLDRRVMEKVMVVSQASMGTFRLGGVVGGVCIRRTEEPVNKTPVIKPPEETPSMIKVYPNPVASGININVGCQKLKEGYYTIQLMNQSGQQIFNKQTWIDTDAQVLNVDIPVVTAGVYFLKLRNKETNKNFTEKIIIE